MISPHQFYLDEAVKYHAKIVAIKRLLFFIGVIRLMFFIGFLLCIYFGISRYSTLFTVIAILCFIAFLVFIKINDRLSDRKNLFEQYHFIAQNEIGIIEDKPNNYSDGTVYKSNERFYDDLDIFGESSLYHFINRTGTMQGADALANLLKNPLINVDSILEQQQAVKTYAPQIAVRTNVMAQALSNNNIPLNLDDITVWAKQPTVMLMNKWLAFARLLFPVVSVITLIFCISISNYYPLVLVAIVAWMHVGYYSKYIQQQHQLISKKSELLTQYAAIMGAYEKVIADDSSILVYYKNLARKAHEEIKQLAKLTNLLDQRMNVLINFFLNSFIIYDIQCVRSLEKWKQKNNAALPEWIYAIGQIELLTSLANLAYNHPTYIYPAIGNNDVTINATDLGHPLIKPGENVTNSISIKPNERLLLITGSNMSGKTTFLRTLGTNVVLAQCGAPVYATSFTFMPMHILSSIRISDSLHEHTSYFMAELKRLQEIIFTVATGEQCLILIDEILRGTNSEDKFHGSAAFIKKLIQFNSLTLFATHDLALSNLENEHPNQITNYCFESIIENDTLSFDYRILKGIAQNKNATFLMKQMNII